MSSSLTTRLQEIPGVAEVVVDLTETGGGINVRLEPGADESAVMEKLRSLLAAYGVRPPGPPETEDIPADEQSDGIEGVEVAVTPIDGGARVEVSTRNVRSFRVVAATPEAIAQGLTDAWCQVTGRIPLEVTTVSVGDDDVLTVVMSNGTSEVSGSADVGKGWEDGLAKAVGNALSIATDDGREMLAINS